jgi:pimeloyl-ACP methyl ester carboxylesterase
MPVVLLHGLSNSRRTYAAVVAHLHRSSVARGEHQLLNVDLRGHGQSTRASLESYDAPSFAADVAALIESTVGRPAIVVGHSLGGVVASALAATRPDLVCALFLEDPPLFEGDDDVRKASPVASLFPKMIAAVRALQERDAPAAEYEPLTLATTAPDEVADRCAGLREWDPTTMQAAIDGIVWRGFDPEATITAPCTILRADPACGAAFGPADAHRIMAANPHTRIVEVAGATHAVHGTPTRAAYLDQLDGFLASL